MIMDIATVYHDEFCSMAQGKVPEGFFLATVQEGGMHDEHSRTYGRV